MLTNESALLALAFLCVPSLRADADISPLFVAFLRQTNGACSGCASSYLCYMFLDFIQNSESRGEPAGSVEAGTSSCGVTVSSVEN